MNKRGYERSYYWIFYLIMAVIVFWVLFNYISEAANSELTNKNFIARDVALFIDTLYIAPGNVKADYSFDRRFYSLYIRGKKHNYKVAVRDIDFGAISEYRYIGNEYRKDITALIGLEDGIENIKFTKLNGDIFVEEDFPIDKKITFEDKNKLSKKDFGWPIDSNIITSCFGMRNIDEGSREHEGIDIRTCEFKNGECVNYNKKVRVVGKGKIIGVLFGKAFDDTIIVDHGDNVQTFYSHLSKSLVEKGDKVEKGQVIGIAGKHNVRTPHLHFAIKVRGNFKDPLEFYNTEEVKFAKTGNCYYYSKNYGYGENIIKNVIG